MTSPTPRATPSVNDQMQLIEGCRHCMAQCDSLLKLISHQDFVDCSRGASVGAHMRHVLDRFLCLFNGLPSLVVDYDARKRDRSIETNLQAAAFALASVSKRIDAIAQTSPAQMTLSVQESVFHEGPAVALQSTLERELMGLITHTTHHLALIALLAKSMGYALDADFGKAASTIRYERALQQV